MTMSTSSEKQQSPLEIDEAGEEDVNEVQSEALESNVEDGSGNEVVLKPISKETEKLINENHDGNNSANNEDGMVRAMTEDIYSLIYTSDIHSVGFRFAMVIFVIQLFLEVLILFDLLDLTSGENILQVPSGITVVVRCAQILGVTLISFSVLSTGDLSVGLIMLANGYDETILERNPHALYWKWLASGVLQVISGAIMMGVYFILLIQSTTIIGLMLNFAALNFVGEIDDMCFAIASRGYFGRSVAADCDRVGHVLIAAQKQKSVQWRVVLLLVINIILFIPYGFVAYQQLHGTYLCQSIFLQYGDAYYFQLSYFSGLYHQSERRINGRSVYVDRSGMTQLSYCDYLQFWTISTFGEDPCHFLLHSPFTTTYDVVSTQDDTWRIVNIDTLQVFPADRFYMECKDCDDTEYGECQNGNCSNNQCICNDGYYGVNCEFSEACELLTVDARSESLQAGLPDNVDTLDLSTFQVLRDVDGELAMFNYRPIYVSTSFLHPEPKFGKALMIFFGRRWAITLDIFLFHELDPCWDNLIANGTTVFDVLDYYEDCGLPSLDRFIKYLTNEFHPVNSGADRYIPYFFSSTVDVGTPTDSFIPADLSWFRSTRGGIEGTWQLDPTQPPDSVLICPFCNNNTNPCRQLTICNSTNQCECEGIFDGALCERSLTCLDDGMECQGNSTCLSDGSCKCEDDNFFGAFCQLSV